jgi:hypothetical protein
MMFKIHAIVGLGLSIALAACGSVPATSSDASTESDLLVLVDHQTNHDLPSAAEDLPLPPPKSLVQPAKTM